MIRILVFFLCFKFFSLHQEPTTLEVVSYNIRYNNPDDGKNQWKYRKASLFNYLNEKTPTVVGMQEVLHDQLLDLQNALVEYSYVGIGREDGKTKGEYSPIFYNTQALELVTTNTFWLSQTPDQISVGWDAALERICTYALFEDRQSKKRFWVFNTHFDHVGTTARAESAKLILEKINSLNENKLPIVITGDFNLTPETTPIQILQEAYEDVLINLPSNAPLYGTFTGFEVEKKADRRIDYIFQKGFQIIAAKHLSLKTPEGLWVSDHHPVWLKCSF